VRLLRPDKIGARNDICFKYMNVFNSLGSNYSGKEAIQILLSPNNKANSEKLIKLLQERYSGKAILCYKGREALMMALQAVQLPFGSYVAINGFTCIAVYQAIVSQGLKVEYLDIDDGLNFSPDSLEKALKKNLKIKAVIIQNTLGYTCDVEAIIGICRKHDLILIEDLAHSVGLKYDNGQEAGTVGDFIALSFSQDKMIDAVSGGALIIRNRKYDSYNSESLQTVSQYKQIIDMFYPFFTFIIRKTYRLGIGKIAHFMLKKLNLLSKPIEIGNGKIHSLPSWYCVNVIRKFKDLAVNIEHRKRIVRIYSQKLNKKILNNAAYLRFPIMAKDRTGLISYLNKKGIYISDSWYDAPIAPKKFINLTDYKGQCPYAEKITNEIVNIPTHRNVSEIEAELIAKEINIWKKSV
jgi:perosamine synthetase